jgi:hypothetical protein
MPSPNRVVGDASVGVGDVNAEGFQIAEALVYIDAGDRLALMKFDGFQKGPGSVLLRQVVTRRSRRDAEDAARTSEDMYFHGLHQEM